MIDPEQIKSKIKRIINLLRKDNCLSGSYSSYIFPLLLLKWLPYLQLDVKMSSEAVVFFKDNSWSKIESFDRDIGKKLTDIFSWIELENSSFEREFTNRDANKWTIISDSTLSRMIENISIFDLPESSSQRSDLICDIYETIIIDTGSYESKSNINLYTPRDLAKLVVALISPKSGIEICDPAFGFGGILIESVRYLINQGEDPRTIHIWGQEKNYELRSTVSMILSLHGVLNFDVLKEKYIEPRNNSRKFDAIISNPPFGAKSWEDYGQDNNSLYLQYGYPPKNSADYTFILKVVSVLNDKGKSAIIVPHGVLFREGAEGKIRKNIIEDDLIEAIISLPQGLFYNTRIPTAIVVFNKDKRHGEHGTLFIDASNEYGVSRKRNFLTSENIARICHVYANSKQENGYSRIVSKDEIRHFDYNLNPNLYIQKEQKLIELDINLQVKKVHDLELQRERNESEMNVILNTLNIKI
jgi:type I restriction enzyme M protein